MKRKTDNTENSVNKKRTLEMDALRTTICFDIFTLSIINGATLESLVERLVSLGLLDFNLVIQLFEPVSNEEFEIPSSEDSESSSDPSLNKYSLPSILDHLIAQGVNINECHPIDNKSFLHHYYELLKWLNLGKNSWHSFSALISSFKNDGKLAEQYSNLIIDKPFLQTLLTTRDWPILAICRGAALSKCADQDEIEALVNDDYRTSLCLKIFKWQVWEKEETQEIMLAAINTQAMFFIMKEYDYTPNDYKNTLTYNDFVTGLVGKLVIDGVNINHHMPDKKSFVHQYYLFEKHHLDMDYEFRNITQLNKKVKLDKGFLERLLKDRDWSDFCEFFITHESTFSVEMTPEFHQRLKRDANENSEDFQSENELNEFLGAADRFLIRYENLKNLYSKFKLFRLATSDSDSTYLPRELSDSISQTLMDSCKQLL